MRTNLSPLQNINPTARGRAGLTGSAESGANESGDVQKKLDVVANEIFCRAVADTGRTGLVVSEEENNPISVETSGDGSYVVCFGAAGKGARGLMPLGCLCMGNRDLDRLTSLRPLSPSASRWPNPTTNLNIPRERGNGRSHGRVL